ncbi:MAG: hypothetical protein ACJA0U_002151 [Salibacteraceae bacterium]|jgi:hypothetical protein
MTNKLLILFCVLVGTVNAQVIVKEYPDTVWINRMFLTPTEEANFNSDESLKKCSEVLDKMKASNRSYSEATPYEQKILSNCEEVLESPWDIIGGCSWYCGERVDTVVATSSLPRQGKHNYNVKNIFDLNYKTAWVEGVPGYGIGEKITYTFPGDHPRVTQIIIVNGYVISEEAWFNNSRVKTLNVYFNNELFATLHLKDTKNDQVFEFDPIGYVRTEKDKGKDTPNWTLSFEIVEVYEGDVYDDTAISELYFLGVDVH